jgi:hypothetical protein
MKALSPSDDQATPEACFPGTAVRSPQGQTSSIRENALDYEIIQEQAAALGRLGRALEAALRDLSAHDADRRGSQTALASLASASQEARTRLIEEASHALWCFIIQREACGLRDEGAIVREYRVPAEVRNRVGLFAGNRRRPAG